MATITVSGNTGSTVGGVLDTALDEFAPTTNFSADTQCYIDTWNTNKIITMLIIFPIPSGSGTVSNSKVRLYLTEKGGAQTDLSIYEILRTDVVTTQATATIYKTSNNWTTSAAQGSGTDRSASAIATGTVSGVATGNYIELTGSGLTALIQDAVTNAKANIYINVQFTNVFAYDASYVRFRTTEGTDGQRPALVYDLASATTHTTTGALVGQGSTIAGSAVNFTVHTTTGALTGQGSVIAGSANNFTVHTTTGVLTGQGSSIVGSSRNFTVHTTSGALSGQGSLIEGAARNFTVHPSSGALVGQGAVIDGVAEHSVSGVHDTTGALVGQGSILDGDADHISVNPPTPTPIPGGGGGITYVSTKIKPKKRIREMLESAYTKVEPVVSTKQEKTLKNALIQEVIKEINQDFTNDNSFDIQSLITLIQIERQKYLRRMRNRKAAIMLLLE